MILVTGGTGLLGTHLILAMHKKGIRPRAIYRTNIPEIIKDKADWVKGDILDIVRLNEVFDGVEQVYHVAAFVSFHKQHKDKMYAANVNGTENIVNACLEHNVTKLVHVSSVAAMGRNRPGEPINEKMFWTRESSNSEYSKTKYLGEMEVWRGIGEGLNAVVINPSIIFGEHTNWEDGSMKIFSSIENGFPWYSNGGAGFVDADDIADIMIALMESDISAERFLVSAENLTYKDLFFQIADALKVKRPHKPVSSFLAAIVWRLEKIRSIITGKLPLVTKETANSGLTLVHVNNSKLLKALPAFSYRAMNETLNRIAANKPV